MGLLDDAIREHLELKRRRGADPGEVERQENEVLGEKPRAEFVDPSDEAEAPPAQEPVDEPVAAAEEPVEAAEDPVDAGDEREPFDVEALEEQRAAEPAPAEPEAAWLDDEPDEVPAEESLVHPREEEPPAEGEDVLEDTPEFLQETPEHDRLWFEQRPPRDFDWDK